MKTITIGIPVYEQAGSLPDAIESALGQTYPCEVIVVNDGSPDNAAEVAASYPGVKVINQVNKGLASARNTAIMNATGEYFLPLDADDILLKDCAKRIAEVAEQTDADIIAPSFQTFGTTNNFITLTTTPTLEEFKSANRIGYFSAVKREVLLECGGYSPRMTFGYEDYHLWFDLLSRGKKLVTIPETLVLYRTKEHSMIHEADAHREELMGQIREDFPKLYPPELYA